MNRAHLACGILAVFVTATTLAPISNLLAQGDREEKRLTDPVRVLIYGDAGDGGPNQFRVGSAMAGVHRQLPFHMAVSVGDNLYGNWQPGVFARVFEQPYAPLIADGVRFYQAVGNHDIEDGKMPKELEYSRDIDAERRGVGGWVLPAENYTVERGNTRWIFLNVASEDNAVSWTSATAQFAQANLCRPFEGWTFLVFHYPMWSTNAHGDNAVLQGKLLPLMQRCPPNMIFAGHEHFAEFIHPWNWIPQITMGNGHEIRNEVRPSARESLFAMRELGFGVLSVQGDHAQLSFRDQTGASRYSMSWQRQPALRGEQLWGDIWMQSGNRLLSRVKWDAGLASQLEVEIGFSDSPADPVWNTETFTFIPAQYQGLGNSPELLAFGGAIPDGFSTGYAVARFRPRGSSAWIYGDRADGPGLHGNYDGIQVKNLLRFRKLQF